MCLSIIPVCAQSFNRATDLGPQSTSKRLSFQYQVNGGSWEQVPQPRDVGYPITVPFNASVQFKATLPDGITPPEGKPQWSSNWSESISGTGNTKSVVFDEVSEEVDDYKDVTVECGHSLTADVLVVSFDMDIDADNSSLGEYPNPAKGDRGETEEAAEANQSATVYANFVDPDSDGIPGYADGINKFGNGQANSCWKFEPIVIEVSPLPGLPNAKFVFRYSASDPDQMTQQTSGANTHYILPTGKVLRLWTKDGDQVRNPPSADQGGDFILSDHEYTAAQLGWLPGATTLQLYIEAVAETSPDQAISLALDFYPMGTNHPQNVVSETLNIETYYWAAANPGMSDGFPNQEQ